MLERDSRAKDLEKAEADLDLIVSELGEVEHKAGWGRVERIASVIAKHLFDDKMDRLCSDDSRRSTSIRAIAARPGCPLSKSQLHETLSAYMVYRSENVARSSTRLTPSHVALVARLPRRERSTLLEQAVASKMSVRELREAARAVRRKQGEKRGRPPTSPVEKAITRLENAVLFLEEGSQYLREASPSTKEQQQLASLLDKAHELLRSATRSALQLRRPGEDTYEAASRFRLLHKRAG